MKGASGRVKPNRLSSSSSTCNSSSNTSSSPSKTPPPPTEILKQLEKFRFPKERVYSHENQTIVIDASTKNLVEDIINLEINSESAKRNGFIVLHFHSDLHPIVTDESVMHFLRVSGEHVDALHSMRPWKYNFENVLMDNHDSEAPTGILCSPKLIQSVRTGTRHRYLLGFENKGGVKKNHVVIKEKANSLVSKGKKAAPSRKRKVVIEQESDGDENVPSSSVTPIKRRKLAVVKHAKKSSKSARSRARVGKRSKSFSKSGWPNKDKTSDVDNEGTSKSSESSATECSDNEAGSVQPPKPVLTVNCDGFIPNHLLGILHRGKLCLSERERGNCLCMENCKILNYKQQVNGAFSLLHYVYLGQLRMDNIRKLYAPTLPEPERGRPYCSELRLCEEILRAAIDISDKNDYSYQYMIYKGFIRVNPPEGSSSGSTTRYDMASHKNQLDDCQQGHHKDGIGYPWTYLGFGASIFPVHLEDMGYLNSINYMAYGASKVWIFVPPSHVEELQTKVVTYLNTHSTVKKFSKCTLQHKLTFIHPALLEMWNIPYKIVVQKPGQLIVTAAAAFHWGFNLGFNLNYAKNAIYHDYRMQMLKSLYMSCNDPFMCPANCRQTPVDDVASGVFDRFILSFYKTMFKSNPYDIESTRMSRLMGSIFEAKTKDERDTVLAKNGDFIAKMLERCINELEECQEKNKGKLLKVILRMKCATVREVSGMITVNVLDYDHNIKPSNLFPRKGFTLSAFQKSSLFNQLPYTHIRVTYDVVIPSISTRKKGKKKVKHPAAKTEVCQAMVVMQSFDDLRDYWTSVNLNSDYVIVHQYDHKGQEKHLDVLKLYSSEKPVNHDHIITETTKTQKKRKVVVDEEENKDDTSDEEEEEEDETDDQNNEEVDVGDNRQEEESSGDSSEDENETDTNSDDERLTEQECEELLAFAGDFGFRVLQSLGHLHLVVLNNKHWFVCDLCFRNFETTITSYVAEYKGERVASEIGKYLQNKIKRQSGISADASNMRHHIKAQKVDYNCQRCGRGFRSKYAFASHLRSRHQNHRIHCPLCLQSFRQVVDLRRHWSDPASACVLVDIHISKKNQVDVLQFRCSRCNKFMNKIQQWKEHLTESKSCRKSLDIPEYYLTEK